MKMIGMPVRPMAMAFAVPDHWEPEALRQASGNLEAGRGLVQGTDGG
jgi:hypothetical protein